MQTKELVPLTFQKILQTKAYTVITVNATEISFEIYTEAQVGRTLQMHLSQAPKPRPFTHDLISNIFTGFKISVKQVVITDLQETVFFARLFLEQKRESQTHIVEVDARPSDCLTLALLHEAPLFCTKELLEKVIPLES